MDIARLAIYRYIFSIFGKLQIHFSERKYCHDRYATVNMLYDQEAAKV